MKKLAIILGILALVKGAIIIGLLYTEDSKEVEYNKDSKWGKDVKPPARYKEFCNRTGFEWDITYQSEYMLGNTVEDWKVDENGDSILNNIFIVQVSSDDSELSDMEKSKIKRGREIAKEQWDRIKENGNGESVKQYSGE